ncbi:hypothetical protein DYB32_006133 [Aphanomyces invadans]|uniref:INTS8 TPR repeats domain-containing protein n=1 Tax=Aphanomyces invadans TaxID=157072 RepID=A0A3R6WJW1_9STRA|nr:hypothetical protein DYB32_006133 [Aphanomyces invadans]
MECPGTPRPSDDDVQDIIDKRGLVFGLGGSTARQPPPSPNSPARPVPAADRTYRSVFQQPAIEVQPAYAENDWYDFLFLPAKLLAHTQALKANPTLTPTAHDVLTELLRKAKPSGADEPTKARDHTLQCLAALVVLQLQFTLEDIEATVPTNLQKGLLDGLVKYASDPKKGGLNLHDVAHIHMDDAILLHNRWQLRIAIKKMLMNALTVSNKLPLSDNLKPPPDEVEQLASISGLVPVAQLLEDIQMSLATTPSTNPSPSTVSLRHALRMDLGIFHFHQKQYDMALACFQTLVKVQDNQAPLGDKMLVGYLHACESVVGKAESSLEESVAHWWAQSDWPNLIQALEKDNLQRLDGTPSTAVLSTRQVEVATFAMAQCVLVPLLLIPATTEPRSSRFNSIMTVGICALRRILINADDVKYLHGHVENITAADPERNHQVEAFQRAIFKGIPLRPPVVVADATRRQQRLYQDHPPFMDTPTECDAMILAMASRMLHQSQWAELSQVSWKAHLTDTPGTLHLVCMNRSPSLHNTAAHIDLADLCAVPADKTSRLLTISSVCGALMHTTSRLVLTASPSSLANGFPVKIVVGLLDDVVKEVADAAAPRECLVEWVPVPVLDTIVSLTAGLLQRAYALNLCEYRVSYDLTPYGDLAILMAFAPDNPTGVDAVQSVKATQSEIVQVHLVCLQALVTRCPRDPRWHCARADVAVNPIVLQKLSSAPGTPQRGHHVLDTRVVWADFTAAVRSYLVAASLATNFFEDAQFADVIDHGSLVRLSYCLVKLGAHVAAAVLYQIFPPDEVAYGLRILHLLPAQHDAAFFQYIWELSYLETLVHLHANTKHKNPSHVEILTQLIQCPELNASNPIQSKKEMEQRILRSYFRELCRLYLVAEHVPSA